MCVYIVYLYYYLILNEMGELDFKNTHLVVWLSNRDHATDGDRVPFPAGASVCVINVDVCIAGVGLIE